MSDAHVIVFLRHPEKGKVKSRIASEAGEEEAFRIYETLYNQTMNLAADLPYKVTIYSTSVNDAEGFRQQQGDDLGGRMCNAFLEVIAEGSSPVIIIGSDCPGLDTEIIDEAIGLLSDVDVVIGPSEDGGYYLLGMNEFHEGLFQNVSWGTEQVLRQTMDAAESDELTVFLLRTLYDVDTVEDAGRAGLIG